MKIDETARRTKKIFGEQPEKIINVNKYLKAMIINFGDERGDIIVSNDNFGTRRKYPDFTEGKKKAGLHPMQFVYWPLDMMRISRKRYVGADGKVHTFGVDDDF